jgi:O-acetyl-ADP-ribose deacetylase
MGEGQISAGGAVMRWVVGDITTQDVDVIVNAANTSLLGGGGVDGAIHRAGGPAILEECRAIRARQGGCAVGEAVMTTGGELVARYVIHTVGPVWQNDQRGESGLLRSCYRSSLELAHAHALRTIAFPSISTGAYRFPFELASRIALDEVHGWLDDHPGALDEVRFVLFSAREMELFGNVTWRHCST